MRFWFEHSSDVSLREQLVTQVMLGILCGELAPGERLPSIRDLAQRFALHSNTISAGYRQLEAEGWVASRKGSGVFVRTQSPPPGQAPSAALDRLLANMFRGAARLGIEPADVRARVAAYTLQPTYSHIFLVDPEPEARAIIAAELALTLHRPVPGGDLTQAPLTAADTLLLTRPSKLAALQSALDQAGQPRDRAFCLRVRSVPQSLADHLPALRKGRQEEMLIAVASRWPEFLRFANTMLIASGLAADTLLLRDAREPNWREGLATAAAVICDSATATEFNARTKIVFTLLAEDTAPHLQNLLA